LEEKYFHEYIFEIFGENDYGVDGNPTLVVFSPNIRRYYTKKMPVRLKLHVIMVVTVTRHGVRSRLAEGIGKYNFGIISYINR
jgi:hypothetical protein